MGEEDAEFIAGSLRELFLLAAEIIEFELLRLRLICSGTLFKYNCYGNPKSSGYDDK